MEEELLNPVESYRMKMRNDLKRIFDAPDNKISLRLAAEYLNVSKSTLHRWITDTEIIHMPPFDLSEKIIIFLGAVRMTQKTWADALINPGHKSKIFKQELRGFLKTKKFYKIMANSKETIDRKTQRLTAELLKWIARHERLKKNGVIQNEHN